MTPAGIARVGAERTAAQAGLKMSSLSDAKVYLGGTAATFKYMADGAKYDHVIAVVSALTLNPKLACQCRRAAVGVDDQL
jgi:RND superfamily putative drug exporter